MPRLFLSHAGAENDRAQQLADAIEASPEARQHGITVWIDKRDLVPGAPWQDQLEAAIEKGSSAFGLLLTKEGVRNWVRLEVRAALDRVIAEQRNGRHYPFIPIIATDEVDISALPAFVQQYQGVKLDHEGKGLAALIRIVAGLEPGSPVALIDEPFVGLDAFEAKDAALFFGRVLETRQLVDRLKRANLVMVVGDSGSGKSSLVKAGLVPAFCEGAFADRLGRRPDPSAWHVVEMRPGLDPYEGLVDGVSRAAKAAGRSLADLDTLNERVRSKDPDKIRDALHDSGPEGASLLLVVDQFEELWTLGLDEGKRRAFLAGLLALATRGDMRHRVVGTLRRDYYHLCSDHDGLRSRLLDDSGEARFLLGTMTEAGLRDAVQKPLVLAGVADADAGALADEVVKDIAGQPGNLALMEMALTETWSRRTEHGGNLSRAYERIDRLEGALATAAEDVFWNPLAEPSKLTPGERPIAEALFMRLVRSGDAGGATRRIVRQDELEGPFWRVAQKLATKECRRLLVVRYSAGAREADESAATIELAHEQLVTQWRDYGAWLRGTGDSQRHAADPARAGDKRALDRLIDATAIWSERGRHAEDLARGGDLEDFTGLYGRRPSWLAPIERELVALSRTARDAGQRRQKLLTWTSWATAVMFSGVATMAVVQSYRANREVVRANRTLATALWNDLRFDEGATAHRELNALWELTRNRAIHEPFVDELRRDAERRDYFARSPAAVGRSLGLRWPSPEQAQALLVPILAAWSESGGGDDNGTLALVQALAPRLLPEAAEKALWVFHKRPGGEELARASVIQALALQLAPEQAEAVLVAVLAPTPWKQRPFDLRVLATTVAALGPTKEKAKAALTPVLDAMRSVSGPFSYSELNELAAATRVLAPLLAPESALVALNAVIDVLARSKNPDTLRALAAAVQSLGPTKEQAKAALEPVLDAMRSTSDWDSDLPDLAAAIQALAPSLSPESAQGALHAALDAIPRIAKPDTLRRVTVALQSLVPQLTADKAQAAFGRVLDAIRVGVTQDQLEALVIAVQFLAAEISDEQADAILVGICCPTEPDQLLALAGAAGVYLPGMQERVDSALDVVRDAALSDKRPQCWPRLRAMAAAVQALPKRASKPPAPPLGRVLAAMLAEALQALAPTLAPEAAEAALSNVIYAIRFGGEDRILLGSLAAAAEALARTVPPESVPQNLGHALAPLLGADPARAFAPAVELLASRLLPEHSEALLSFVLERIGDAPDAKAARPYAAVLRILGDALTPEQRWRGNDIALSLLGWASDEQEAAAAAGVLSALLLHDPLEKQSLVAVVVEALKYPTATGEATTILLEALRERVPEAPGKDKTLEANLTWIAAAYPAIDLESAPACPSPRWRSELRCPSTDEH